MKKRLKDESGWLLIEVVFAAGIMAVSLSMIYGSMISLSDLGSLAETREIASSDLSTFMEQLRSSTVDEALALQPVVKPREKIEVACVDATGAVRPLPLDPKTLSEPLPNPLEVRVTLTWILGRGRTQSVSASALLAR